jgi:predicted ATPase
MSDLSMFEDDDQPRGIEAKRRQFVVLSGCSGACESALLDELASRGHQVFGEPGRQIVKEQLHIGADTVPWRNIDKFIELSISRSMHQMVYAASTDRLSSFDRGTSMLSAFWRVDLRAQISLPWKGVDGSAVA